MRNPRLRGGWLSRGRPDRLLVIVRVVGPHPKNCDLVDGNLKPVGEWRVDGSQSIIPPSLHPDTGKPYEMVSAKSPVVLPFTEINWPFGVSLTVSMDSSITDPTTQLLSSVTGRLKTGHEWAVQNRPL